MALARIDLETVARSWPVRRGGQRAHAQGVTPHPIAARATLRTLARRPLAASSQRCEESPQGPAERPGEWHSGPPETASDLHGLTISVQLGQGSACRQRRTASRATGRTGSGKRNLHIDSASATVGTARQTDPPDLNPSDRTLRRGEPGTRDQPSERQVAQPEASVILSLQRKAERPSAHELQIVARSAYMLPGMKAQRPCCWIEPGMGHHPQSGAVKVASHPRTLEASRVAQSDGAH